MSAVTGFKIDFAASNFDVTSEGVVFNITGNYTADGPEFISTAPSLVIVENGMDTFPAFRADFQPSSVPGEFGGTFKYEIASSSMDSANLQIGDEVQFRFSNPYTGEEMLLTPIVTMYCFFPGTMIATPAGEAAVETLAIGDMVLRLDGTAAPIRWMGRSSVVAPFVDKVKALPIRIRKDALADNVPSRDLLVSPDHAILVDGNLVQAAALVNGTSVVRETDVPLKFVYHHIELADHALVMAENTPAETFIDNVDRIAFDNWAEHQALYGDEVALVEMDLPRAKSQRQVPSTTRQHLAERAVELGYAAAAAA